VYAVYKTDISFAVLQGTKIGLQIFTLALPNALDDWNIDGHFKSGDDPCIFDVNFVGF